MNVFVVVTVTQFLKQVHGRRKRRMDKQGNESYRPVEGVDGITINEKVSGGTQV